MIGYNVHQAYQLRPGSDPIKVKLECLDASNDFFCYGENKGLVALNRLEISETELKTLETAKGVPSKSNKIEHIEMLKTMKFTLVLVKEQLLLLDNSNMTLKKTIAKGVTTFAVSQNDQIAFGSGKKLQVVIYKPESNDCASLIPGKSIEIYLPETISKLTWNDELIGATLKKTYVIVGYQSQLVSEVHSFGSTPFPFLLTFKDTWLGVSGDNILFFEKGGKSIPSSIINIQASVKANPIVSMVVKGNYLIVLRETIINVYNLLDYSKVQDIELEKGDLGKDLATSSDKILIGVEMTSASKKEPFSKIVYLKPIPPEEQIKRLLLIAKISEASKVFSQNVLITDPSYPLKKEVFNAEAGWALFTTLEFAKAVEFFSNVNYDPREFLALIPDYSEKKKDVNYKTIKDIVESKGPAVEKPDMVIQEGIKNIIKLAENKRKYLAEKPELGKEYKKGLVFVYPSLPLNDYFRTSSITYDEMLELLDTSLMKLYVEQKDLRQIQAYFDSTKLMKCNYKSMLGFLKERLEKDKTLISHVCLAYLHDKYGYYTDSLDMWKNIGGQGIKEPREIACKETTRILISNITDKKQIFDYAKMILVFFPDEGMKIFTTNESLSKFINEDDIINYFEGIGAFQAQLKEKYLEYLVTKKDTDERFHTLLGLHYIGLIKEALLKEKKKTVEVTTDPNVNKNRDKLNRLLKQSSTYNIPLLLSEMKGLGMFEEEISLFSKQKMHKEALSSLVDLGKTSIDFTKAEQYCLEQSEPLLHLLFEKILELYKDAKNRHTLIDKDKSLTALSIKMKPELENLKKLYLGYEAYCKGFLKKFAANDKMNAEEVIKSLPEEWGLKEQKDGKGDELLYQFIVLALNDRLAKENNIKIAKNVGEMYKLNLENTLIKLHRPYAIITPERKCKVCLKPLAGAKSFYVFPNGIVAHSHCVKEPTICPVTNINFTKKIYQQ